MIYDRKQSDIDEAKVIIKEKVQKNISLTEDEISILAKGTLTIEDLNRIETKQKEVSELMKDIGYFGGSITNKIWDNQGIFNIDDFNRILNNLNVLKQSFFVYSTTPQTPDAKYHYENINRIEKILFDLETMIEDIKKNYRECGNFECGGDIID